MTSAVAAVADAVRPVDLLSGRRHEMRQRASALPAGSLGRLHEVARRVATIQRSADVAPLQAAISVLAADHGVATNAVSKYDSGMTSRVLALIERGDSPLSAVSRRIGAPVVTADFGVIDTNRSGPYRIAAGTKDISVTDAMTFDEAERAIGYGIAYAADKLAAFDMVAVGELGIGNTTSTAAMACMLLSRTPGELVGHGSGIDDEVLRAKQQIVERAVARASAHQDGPIGVLGELGGFEIAGNVGVILWLAANRRVVLLDGYISSLAGLLATQLAPDVTGYLIASHLSTEPGHCHVLDALGAEPLLDLRLRLGMGSGAALAIELINTTLAVLEETPRMHRTEVVLS